MGKGGGRGGEGRERRGEERGGEEGRGEGGGGGGRGRGRGGGGGGLPEHILDESFGRSRHLREHGVDLSGTSDGRTATLELRREDTRTGLPGESVPMLLQDGQWRVGEFEKDPGVPVLAFSLRKRCGGSTGVRMARGRAVGVRAPPGPEGPGGRVRSYANEGDRLPLSDAWGLRSPTACIRRSKVPPYQLRSRRKAGCRHLRRVRRPQEPGSSHHDRPERRHRRGLGSLYFLRYPQGRRWRGDGFSVSLADVRDPAVRPKVEPHGQRRAAPLRAERDDLRDRVAVERQSPGRGVCLDGTRV